MITGRRDSGPASIVMPVGLILAACCALAAAGAGRVFDISDDSYYILSVLDAGYYRQSLTEFGYAWRTVFRILGGDLHLFRLVGMIFLLVCARWFAAGIGTQFFPRPEDAHVKRCAVLAIVTCAFWQYGSWLVTPNYNLLNLGGLLLFFGGILLAPATDCPQSSRAKLVGAAVVAGAGLCMTMLAKPTTTVLATLLGFSWIMVAPPRRAFLAFSIAMITALAGCMIAILLIDGNLADFLARKIFSLHAMAVLDRGNGLSGLRHALVGPFEERGIPKVIAVAGVASVVLIFLTIWWRAAVQYGQLPAGLVAVAAALLLAAMRARDFTPPLAPAFHFWHLALLLAALVIVVAIIARAPREIEGTRLAKIAILMALPLAYSLGTNTTIALHISGAAIFWCAAAIAILGGGHSEQRYLVPAVAFLFGVLTLGILAGVAIAPLWNAAPLWRQNQPLVLRDGMQVKVDPATKDYMAFFHAAARANGFRDGTPVLDLTGQGPGVVLALGGIAPGVPWLHHGGSNVMAYSRMVLGAAPIRQLRSSWVITSVGAQGLSEGVVLRQLGLEFPRGYRLVVSRAWPEGEMAYTLWKPAAP